jgi:hypothetical protein
MKNLTAAQVVGFQRIAKGGIPHCGMPPFGGRFAAFRMAKGQGGGGIGQIRPMRQMALFAE